MRSYGRVDDGAGILDDFFQFFLTHLQYLDVGMLFLD
jgi:hypothetical protein